MQLITNVIRIAPMKPFGLLVLLIFFSTLTYGQTAQHILSDQQDTTTSSLQPPVLPHDPGFAKIFVIARANSDSIVLRWAPSTPHGWRLCNRIGYIIERQQGSEQFVRQTSEPEHPWLPDEIIVALEAHKENSYLILALTALWGDTTLMGLADSLGLDTLANNAEKNLNLYSYSLLAADNDALAAEALGLRFVDRNVRAGERYTYRVRMNGERDYRVEAGEVTVVVRAAKTMGLPPKLSARGLDGRIELEWEKQAENPYSGYYVYRSDDGGKTYRQMNEAPTVIVTTPGGKENVIATFIDTTITNYKVYKYRVRGIDAFAELGPAAEVKAYGRDLTPPLSPRVKNPEPNARNKIQLTWEMSETSADLAGFHIFRSAFPDSNFSRLTKKLLPKTARIFVDETTTEAEPYYKVGAADTAGNIAVSFSVYGVLIDTIPPAVPTGLTGAIDTNGVVRLHWNRGKERNLLGYRVLMANAPEHEFAQMTGNVLEDTVFTDTVTINTLTRHVYYRIASVNNRYNHSKMSPILTLLRPDRVPPEAPVFTDVLVSDSSVVLQWAPSTSADLHSHQLHRRIAGTTEWKKLAEFFRRDSSYADTAVVQNTVYEYLIIAVDSTGNWSPAELPVQARPYDSGVRPPVTALRASFDKGGKKVVLNWAYSSRKQEKFFFAVYKKTPGGLLREFRAVESSQLSFSDSDLTANGMYEYAIKVRAENGAESQLSEHAQTNVEVE